MMNRSPSFVLVLGSASRDQVGGALSYAAVPRVGLGPTPPPLCRYAERTTDLIQATKQIFNRCAPTMFAAPRRTDVQTQRCRKFRNIVPTLSTQLDRDCGQEFGMRSLCLVVQFADENIVATLSQQLNMFRIVR
jgi:hypothetical protein